MNLVLIILLLLNPIEYFLGISLTGVDFLIPLFLFLNNRRIYTAWFPFLLALLLFITLIMSAIMSSYNVRIAAILISILYYLYPYIITFISGRSLDCFSDLRSTANLFIWTFLIVRVLMFTSVDQKAFPLHDYAFCTVLLTFSFLYYYYYEVDENKRALILLLIFVLLLSVLMLKTIFALTLFLVWDYFRKNGLFLGFGIFLVLSVILYISPVFDKISAYYTMYYLNDNAGEIPRNILNLQAIIFAYEFFPIGVGPGIFWGFPITFFGSDLYYDLGYYMVEGLNPDKFDEVNFIFDVFWAGILGEGGFLACLLFLLIVYYPTWMLGRNNPYKVFFKSFFFLIIFQSIVLSILAQPLFLVLLISYPLAVSEFN